MESSARGLTQKKAGFPCSGLNLGSCFMSQDEGMSESPEGTLEKASSGQSESHHFDTSRGTRNSMLQKVMMPYSSLKWIGIPISLFLLESEPRSPASLLDASVLSC